MTWRSYGNLAEIWSLYFGDRTAEENFWFRRAREYGDTVLSAMSATGEIAAGLARRGCQVTGVDFTPEMIAEGRRLYGDIASLRFVEADLRSLSLIGAEFDFAFIGSADFHHFLSETDRSAVLCGIRNHLRWGGGLMLELWLPSRQSWSSPWRRFDPLRKPADPAVKVWKEGKTDYDAETRIVTITQEVYLQRCEDIVHFPHVFRLQLLERDALLEVLGGAGFTLKKEYGSFGEEAWNPDSSHWIVEFVKS